MANLTMKKTKTTDLSLRSRAFKTTRRRNNEVAAEDYSELIADIIEERGEARVGHIADHLGVSHVTALRTIRRLQEEGYLFTSPHKPVELTAKGKKVAEFSKERHELLLSFFLKLGVPKKVAEVDVEGVEHHISKETLGYIRRFMERC